MEHIVQVQMVSIASATFSRFELYTLPVREEPENLLSQDPDRSLCRECLQRAQCLTNTSHPAHHLMWVVDKVGLHVPSTTLLKHKYKWITRGTLQNLQTVQVTGLF